VTDEIKEFVVAKERKFVAACPEYCPPNSIVTKRYIKALTYIEQLQAELADVKSVCDIYDEFETVFDDCKRWPLAKRVLDIIAEILEANRWIPVSERLPEVPLGDNICSKLVLAYNKDGGKDCVEVSYYNYELKSWQGEMEHITHWREITLPEEE
jgi:hypothetical protein